MRFSILTVLLLTGVVAASVRGFWTLHQRGLHDPILLFAMAFSLFPGFVMALIIYSATYRDQKVTMRHPRAWFAIQLFGLMLLAVTFGMALGALRFVPMP